MDKNKRRYIKTVVADLPVRRGNPMQLSEVKTKRQMRRYIVMSVTEEIVLKYWELIIMGAPIIEGDPMPKRLLTEIREQTCKEAETRWRAKYGQSKT